MRTLYPCKSGTSCNESNIQCFWFLKINTLLYRNQGNFEFSRKKLLMKLNSFTNYAKGIYKHEYSRGIAGQMVKGSDVTILHWEPTDNK